MGPNSSSLSNLQGSVNLGQCVQTALQMSSHLSNKIPGWGNNVGLFWLFISQKLADETRYNNFLVFGSTHYWTDTTTNCQTMRTGPSLAG